MIKRGMNRKGAIESDQLIWMILGFIALVLITIGATVGFGFFTDLFKKASVDKVAVAQKCGQIDSVGPSICQDPIEIADNRYITCYYAVNTLKISFVGNDSVNSQCAASEENVKGICTYLNLTKAGQSGFDLSKVQVDGKACPTA